MELKKNDKIEITINKQGATLVNCGNVLEISENIVALEIDLKSKNCEVISSYYCSDGKRGIILGANENSLHLHENIDRDSLTEIEFPQFKNWSVFSWNIGRYTLNVCLIRIR